MGLTLSLASPWSVIPSVPGIKSQEAARGFVTADRSKSQNPLESLSH